MSYHTKTAITASWAFAALMLAATASAGLITNGDFEATPFDDGWNNTAATQTTGLYGSDQAGAFTTANGRLSQTFDPVNNFTLEFAFSPTNVAGSRTLNVVLYSSPATGMSDVGASLNIRSDASGNLQAFSGAWNTVAGGAAAFTVGNEYMVRVVGHDIGGASSYDLFWTDAGGTTFDNSSLGLTAFQNAPSAAGFGAVAFIKAAGNGGYVVDNVSLTVPEPATIGLVAGMLAFGIVAVRRGGKR